MCVRERGIPPLRYLPGHDTGRDSTPSPYKVKDTGRCQATGEREFEHPRREAGPLNQSVIQWIRTSWFSIKNSLAVKAQRKVVALLTSLLPRPVSCQWKY